MVAVLAAILHQFGSSFAAEHKSIMSACKSDDYATNLLKKIKKIRSEFGDLVMVVDGKEFSVHKIILSATSQYFKFRSLIQYDASSTDPIPASCPSTSDVQINTGSKVELKLPNLSSDTFELVLDYIYSGEISLNDDNIEDILVAADVFVMEELKALCWSYLILGEHITPSNCLGLRTLALRLGSTDVSNLATKCVEKNFLDVYKGEEFLQLSADAIYDILMLEDLNLGHDIDSLMKITETVILKAILCWINHDKAGRQTHLKNLLKTVRWAKIKEDVEEYKSLLEETEWKTLIDETRKNSLQKKKLKMSRGHIDVMVVVGGRQGFLQNVFFIPVNPVIGDRMCLANLKYPRQGHGVVVTGGYMYVVGSGDGEFSHVNECERYDPATNSWTTLASLEMGRIGCKIAAVGNEIFCLGGQGLYGFGQTNEVYDIPTNEWNSFPYIEMMTMRANRYFASLHDKLFYLSETINPSDDIDFQADDEHCLEEPFRLVQCFDPAIDEWSAKSPEYGEITSPPGKAKDCIFIINEKDEFVYDTTRNTWEELPVQKCGGIELSFQGMSKRFDHVITSSDSFYMLHESGILKTSDPRLGEWELMTPGGRPKDFPKMNQGNIVILSVPAEMYVNEISQPRPDSASSV